ncbi:Pimeloyl-ACP methyl ester carboxylesterase [Enhydrobacter aerosaccus]|uniref:Pimeloyl-ACP methyl ester carboxylesterase n=1 Tax=Enhydrobacter aerosaccus TaxID=225324 RepID=A0A1T4TJZ7_9HYPH|nr:alpha/beta hydrolase [Enhydrobacter aerosaccus]SKA40628.1 Pimeloyl-ACP methyl ester carboxylesterase [Enhydrobacter aerosaccus]
MEDWHPEALAAIADRLGIAFDDITPPCARRFSCKDGLSLNVLDWGGSGPAAVLLHGGALTARTWDYVALALRTDARLLCIDLRGHGASDWAEDYSIGSHATDVLVVLDGLRIERSRMVGMSLGGMVACEFALRYPDRTESLAMVDVVSRPLFGATTRMRAFMGGFPGASTVEEVVAMVLAVSPKSDPDRLEYRMRALLKQGHDGRLAWKCDLRYRGASDYAVLLHHLAGFEARVPDMAHPFLLARGGNSRVVSEEAADDFVRRFPDGRWINVENAGHNVQEDNPRDLAHALEVFWARTM